MANWVWRAFRPESEGGRPAGKAAGQDAPVPPDVERAAKGLAAQVWSYGSRTRAQLFAGIAPAVVEEFLSYAVAQQWVIADADLVSPGRINPSLGDMTHLADIDGPSWGPGPEPERDEYLV
jgi:hypothetical protein